MTPAAPTVAAWQNPVAVSFGPGTLAGVGPLCARLDGPALLVTDAGLAGGPIVEGAIAALEQAGARSVVFDGVVPDPGLDVVKAAVDAALRAGAAGVVGIGGGSSMDVAKVCAAAARNPRLLGDDVWAGGEGIVIPGLDSPAPSLFLVQIPTTPATGSEVTTVACITDRRGAKRLLVHQLLRARVAVIDPTLHASLPAKQTAEASCETVCRIVGTWLTEQARRPLADAHAAATLRLVLDRTPAALAQPGDIEARGDLALAATSTQLGWESMGRDPFGNKLWYLQHGLAAAAGATKGAGLAGLLAAYLRAVLAGPGVLGTPARLGSLAALCGLGATPADAAATLLAHLASWGLPASLAELGVDDDAAVTLAETTTAQWSTLQTLGALDSVQLLAIYRDAI